MMMKTTLALVAAATVTEAYMPSATRSAFIGSPSLPSYARTNNNNLRMDTESDVFDMKARFKLEQRLLQSSPISMTIEDAEAKQGMPWKSSIDPKVTDEELLYMPFWEWQMSFMKENLTNLRVMPCTNGKTDFSFNKNDKKKARIVNLCASSDEYRKIRMTYYDAGDNTQVFNAVFYPDPKYNLPVLGIDLLAFNRKKYLAIVDFQPIHEKEEDHAITFEDRLAPIKDQYDSLKGRMSSKFYDETQFFSQQMLFARFEDEAVVQDDLFPAFQSYVQTHLDLIREVKPQEDDIELVLERQQAYDKYSAERDPATGLFCAMFGNDWAMDFVHDFLFSMSEKPADGMPPPMPAFGGPPQKQQQQQGAPAAPPQRESVTASRR